MEVTVTAAKLNKGTNNVPTQKMKQSQTDEFNRTNIQIREVPISRSHRQKHFIHVFYFIPFLIVSHSFHVIYCTPFYFVPHSRYQSNRLTIKWCQCISLCVHFAATQSSPNTAISWRWSGTPQYDYLPMIHEFVSIRVGALSNL